MHTQPDNRSWPAHGPSHWPPHTDPSDPATFRAPPLSGPRRFPRIEKLLVKHWFCDISLGRVLASVGTSDMAKCVMPYLRVSTVRRHPAAVDDSRLLAASALV